MGEYQKTICPGIFKYIGKNETVYGIDYYTGGKKRREIIVELLGNAKQKLKERQDQTRLVIMIEKKNTFGKLVQELAKLEAELIEIKWSGRGDLNSRPLGPEPSALPGCATPRANYKIQDLV